MSGRTARWIAILLLASLLPAIAGAQTWSGLGADNNWSTGANWVGGVAPASSPTTVVVFPCCIAFRRQPFIDVPWTINRIDINDSYDIRGQALTFAGVAPQVTAVAPNPIVSAPLVLTGPTAVSTTHFLTLRGGISGKGPMTVTSGQTRIEGASTFTGGLLVDGGIVTLVSASMPGPIVVTSTLEGTASVAGPITVNSQANFRPSGAFNAGGAALAGTTMFFIIRGTAPQNSFLNVSGVVDLTGGALALGVPSPFSGIGYVPVPGDVFTIIVNDGADPVVGTFAGLPEGAIITFNGVPLRISYVGGTGNDVTLASLAAAAGAAPVPTLSEWALLLLAALVAAVGLRSAAIRGRGP